MCTRFLEVPNHCVTLDSAGLAGDEPGERAGRALVAREQRPKRMGGESFDRENSAWALKRSNV